MTVSAQISGDTQKAEPTATKAEDFVPPYPFRYEKMPPVWSLIGMAKRNFLSIWGVDDFQSRLRSKKSLTRELGICNRPDVVREAFQTNHEVLQRKSPQMRHALQPLLGDGLFISDTETWAKRRKVVAPIIHGSRVRGFAPIMIETIEEKRTDWAAQGEGAEVDALADMAHLTAEIICRTIFGRQLGKDYAAEVVQENPSADKIKPVSGRIHLKTGNRDRDAVGNSAFTVMKACEPFLAVEHRWHDALLTHDQKTERQEHAIDSNEKYEHQQFLGKADP